MADTWHSENCAKELCNFDQDDQCIHPCDCATLVRLREAVELTLLNIQVPETADWPVVVKRLTLALTDGKKT